MTNPHVGDYVLATKYHDGDPGDQWSVGFYDGCRNEHHFVVDNAGNHFRGNGFRRVAKISRECGVALVAHIPIIERSSRSVRGWKRFWRELGNW